MDSNEQKEVVLFYRKSRFAANFSIENSFQRMTDAFPAASGFKLRPFYSSYFSNGILPRIKAVLEARRQQSYINHITGDVHFLAFGLPGNNTILTIHDCGFLKLYKGLSRFIIKKLWLDLPVKHCRVITAVSEATKHDIIRYTGCNPDKIKVIPTIIGNYFQRQDRPFNTAIPQILHIGMAPNKNFERHVQALQGIPCKLFIVGKLPDEHQALLKDYAINYEAHHDLTNAAMQQAYENCDLLLFASTLEGFGMPILEAQTVGRPVITSNISSMPYVAGDAACLVDPFDVSAIREGILKIIHDESYRMQLVEAGFCNVQRFEPKAVAGAYASLYQELDDLLCP